MVSYSEKGFTFKQELREGKNKVGIFLNSGSPVVAEQLSYSGYDWLLVDTQHGPMDRQNLSNMLSAISNGGALSMVRVGSAKDREGIQQALDSGANGILVPYINTKEEAITWRKNMEKKYQKEFKPININSRRILF